MPETYICKGCKSSHVINSTTYFGPDRSPYCSYQCYHGHVHLQRIDCKCHVCDKQYNVLVSKYLEQKGQYGECYCSDACKDNRKKARFLTCTSCNKKKLVPLSVWKRTGKEKYLCADCFSQGIRSIRTKLEPKKKAIKKQVFNCNACGCELILSGADLERIKKILKQDPKKKLYCNNISCINRNKIDTSPKKQCYCGRVHYRADEFCSTTCKDLSKFRKAC